MVRKKDVEFIEKLQALQLRCQEAEKALEHCSAAFELIPLWALERGQNWLPSEVALHLIKKAKASVADYGHDHWHIGNGSPV